MLTVKTNLNPKDFDFFIDFTDKYKTYDENQNCEGKVILLVDGMNGEYAKLIYVEAHIKNCYCQEKFYYPLIESDIPEEVYNEMNKAYTLMYKEALDINKIEHALLFHFS